MGFGKKHDYPPLLPPGRHSMSLHEVKERFVDSFSGNFYRRNLYHELESFIQTLLISGIPCEVWLDGSFLTEKEQPSDLDVTVILEPDVPDTLDFQQIELTENIANNGIGGNLDSFLFVKLPRDDPDFGNEYLDPAYSWGQQYGLESSERHLKGFVVLRLRETDVGLRLCS